MNLRLSLVCLALLSSCGPLEVSTTTLANGELGVLPDRPQKGKLFDYYQAKGAAKWQRNWTSSLDLTGVSWNDSRTCTLIAPQYVVMAAHYVRPADVPVMFHDRQGNPVERYITQVTSLAPMADIAVAKLNMPVPSSIKHYAFASGVNLQRGRSVFVTDQTMAVSVHQIALHSGPRISFMPHQGIDPIYRRNLIVGDSGNPSFILSGGDLQLLETHTYGGGGSGPCYADPSVQAAIKSAISAM